MFNLIGDHSPIGVAASLAVAVVGAWAALDLLRRARAYPGEKGRVWAAAAAVATGTAIWSMHFVAMLSYRVPGETITYDAPLTAASLFLAMAGTGIGFAIIGFSDAQGLRALGEGPPSPLRILAAGTAMGLGICAMHYAGMEALQVPRLKVYDPPLVAASAVLAVVVSSASLAFWLRDRSWHAQLGGSVLLGLAISGMHYTGMTAFDLGGLCATPAPAASGALGGGLLSFVTGGTTAVLVFLAVLSPIASRRSAAEVRRVLEQIPVGVVVMDEAPGPGACSNRAARRLLGERGALAMAEEVLKSGMAHDIRSVRDPDGQERHLEVAVAPVHRDSEEPAMVVVVFQDVSTREYALDALRRSRLMEALGLRAGTMLHDVGNLLQVIVANLRALSLTEDPAVRAETLDSMRDTVGRAVALSRRAGRAGRAAPASDPPAVELDIPAWFRREVRFELEKLLGGTILLRDLLPGDLWPVAAEPEELHLAVLNIAINARDAMPEGGEFLIRGENLDRAPDHADPLGRGPVVRLSFVDTGTGMPAEVAQRIFEPLFTTKPVGHGSGLGMSQVRSFARSAGGGVTVASEAGRGTTVSIFLPLARSTGRAQQLVPRAYDDELR
jgi:NO-binding membrane sensor protein with MHYT domain